MPACSSTVAEKVMQSQCRNIAPDVFAPALLNSVFVLCVCCHNQSTTYHMKKSVNFSTGDLIKLNLNDDLFNLLILICNFRKNVVQIRGSVLFTTLQTPVVFRSLT